MEPKKIIAICASVAIAGVILIVAFAGDGFKGASPSDDDSIVGEFS